jgi:transcriptional regulator with XRE-family HTH domain
MRAVLLDPPTVDANELLELRHPSRLDRIDQQIVVFGENLRRARSRARLTQVELSMAGVLDRAAISRIECGERAPDLPTLLRLCTALEVEPKDLLRGIGPNPSPRTVPQPAKARANANADSDPFATNLKWARTDAGISQETLALHANVDRAVISAYENGRRQPNLRTILKLALKLEVPTALLLDGVKLQPKHKL